MRLVIINNLYKPYNRGGAETVAEKIAAQATAAGHEVFIITTAPDKSYVMDNIYYLKSAYYNLGKKSVPSRILWQAINLFNLRKYYQVKKILIKIKPSLVISNNLMGLGFLLPRLLQKLKIKNVQILHDIQLLHPGGLMYFGAEKIIDSLFARIYQNFTRDLFAVPDLVVSPSRWLLDLYVQKKFFLGATKIVLENPVDIVNHGFRTRFDSARQVKSGMTEKRVTKKNNDKILKFLYVGQIEKHKGIIFLIEAWKTIINPFIELTIIGDGKQSDIVRQAIKSDKRLKWLGRRNKDEVKEAMKNADAIIVPSLCYENSPTVIYEALAVNTPFIGSNIGGIPELAQKYNGILFQAGDSDDLKNKIEYFTKNYSILKDASVPQATHGESENYFNSLLNNLNL